VWGRKKSIVAPSTTSAAALPASPNQVSDTVADEMDDRVEMVVRAEEVTFRKENEFGVWESMSGFGIVVTVKTRLSRELRLEDQVA
jgi:hypothetical protein